MSFAYFFYFAVSLQVFLFITRNNQIKELLHLSTDFQYQNLYKSIVKGMSELGFQQCIFIQHRGSLIKKYNYNYPQTRVWISYVYRPWMKVFFRARVNKIYSELTNNNIVTSSSMIMAYFLMTDGAVAYKAHKNLGIPYVVSIRNSDINYYLKFRPWLKPLARKILSNAKFIIFVSPSYLDAMKEIFGENFFYEVIYPKIEIIGNIINSAWFDENANKSFFNINNLKLIYFGEFSKNKQIESIIRAFDILSTHSAFNASLTLIGNYGDNCKKIREMVSQRQGIKILNKIDDTSQLIKYVDDHDIFIMPSKTETFGMAYIEAMARGLPVIYSKGQGIDGFFPDGFIGYPVCDPIEFSIVERVFDIVKNYKHLSREAQKASKHFTQEKIIALYSKMIRSLEN